MRWRPNVDLADRALLTALMWVCLGKNRGDEFISFTMAGAKVNFDRPQRRRSSSLWADYAGVAELLISHGASLEAIDQYGFTVLMMTGEWTFPRARTHTPPAPPSRPHGRLDFFLRQPSTASLSSPSSWSRRARARTRRCKTRHPESCPRWAPHEVSSRNHPLRPTVREGRGSNRHNSEGRTAVRSQADRNFLRRPGSRQYVRESESL